MQLEQTLRTLCALPAVSGFEMQAAKAVAELFRPYCDSVDADKNGNVIGSLSCGKEGAKTVLLDAHLDQIGFLVTEVLDGGFLRFAPVGGVDPRMLLGGEVTILADEPLYGVVSCMPPHLLKAGEQNKAVPIDQMAIDTGLLDAKSRIRVGTPIVFAQQPIKLAGGQLCSKCLDDRAGVAAILLAMEQLHAAKDKLKCNVAVLISTQEEVTELGAQTGAFTVQPEYAIAVDVTHGRTPDGPSDGVFDLGSGVAVGMGPNLHRGFTKALIKTAKANDIDYTLEIMEGNTGTNAWTMQIVGRGIAMGLLSIPEKYMHTPVEVVKLSDVQAVADLMAEFLRGAADAKPIHYAMCGFILRNTLSENGHVARGICQSCDGMLTGIDERTKIQRNDGVVQFYEEGQGWTDVSEDSLVSMNFWGFTPAIFEQVRARECEFLDNMKNPQKDEFLLPNTVKELIADGECDVKVLQTPSKWYGVTYHEDKEKVQKFISDAVAQNIYPERLWK